MKHSISLVIAICAATLPLCGVPYSVSAQTVDAEVAPTTTSIETALLDQATTLAAQARYENREKLLRQIQLLREANPEDKSRRWIIVAQSLSRADFGASNARALDLSLQLIQLARQSEPDDSMRFYGITTLLQLARDSRNYPLQQKTALAAMFLSDLQDIKRIKAVGPPDETVYMNPSLPLNPPLNQIFFSGMSPSAIQDPTMRAEYEATIAKNNRNVKQRNNYLQATNWERNWGDHAEAYLRDFAASDDGAKAFDALLKTYDIDAESIARIGDAQKQSWRNTQN